ncbi:RidA family protein [Arthrobacter sp. H5]|uniref:RidA family protein n=1 Tax=Arthrobacter sp. H5 TaxID=1267973 RepID=UPI0004817409|nr:RidA family protein [Arthrobacter sp. H5]
MNDPIVAPPAQGLYEPSSSHANLVYSAGMTARENGVLQYKGLIGGGVDMEEAKAAARIASKNAVDAIEASPEGHRTILRVVQTTVYLACIEGFESHSQIADAASEYLRERLGPQILGARAAIGVSSLPGGSPVEIQLTATVQTVVGERR